MGDARASDDGFSLVELVITITIIGIVIAPVMNSVIATVRASSSTRQMAQVETVVQNAADRVNRAPKGCDYTIFVQAATQSQGWTAAEATVVQKHYLPGPSPVDAGTWVAEACNGPVPTDLLVQLVTITVRSPDRSISKTIEVVKSDV